MTHLSLLCVRCRPTTALTDEDSANDVRLLDAQERETCQRFLAREDRRDYAAAHALLRRTLTSLQPSHQPHEWRFARNAHGKPRLSPENVKGRPLRFSLTHTRGYVACAVSPVAEVGIDAECRSHINDLDMLMAGICAAEEQAQVDAVPASARAALFLDFCALKEAYAKACGTGIAMKLADIAFDLRAPATILAAFEPAVMGAWWFGLFRPSLESRIALAIAPERGRALALDAAIVRPDGLSAPMHPVRASGPLRLAAPAPE